MNDKDFEFKHVEDDLDFVIDMTYEPPPTIKDMVTERERTLIGEINSGNVPCFIHGIAFKQIIRYFLTRPNLELEGALIGRYCEDLCGRKFIEIVSFCPFVTAKAAPGSTAAASEKEWLTARKQIDEMRSGDSDVWIVGWAHSHPGMKPAPSDTDIGTIKKHFFLPWQVALIIDPVKKRVGVFEYSNEKGVINKNGLIGYDDGDGSRFELNNYSYCSDQHF